ncbi:MAG TPA: hypothetical protein VM186_04830 [Planctomycetota bacterium]|nr:hypothetical protein [Planctomycetota bacterium]
MSKNDDKPIERREFIRGIFRKVAFLGLAAGSGALAARKAAGPSQESECINRGICRNCSALVECGLPQALSTKDGMGAK